MSSVSPGHHIALVEQSLKSAYYLVMPEEITVLCCVTVCYSMHTVEPCRPKHNGTVSTCNGFNFVMKNSLANIFVVWYFICMFGLLSYYTKLLHLP